MAAKYCPNCSDEVTVIETVDWQPDVCGECGNPLPED